MPFRENNLNDQPHPLGFPMMNDNEKSIVWSAARQFLYCAGCFAVTALEHAVAIIYQEKTFDENGFMENLQLGELLFASAVFLAVSFRRENVKKLSIVFSALCIFAACRELDNVFDDAIPLIGWKFAFVFIVASIGYALHHWQRTREELFNFLRHPSFLMMCCAMTIIIPVAQCVGHRSFVINVLQIEHVGEIKEFIEESIETAGYFILLCSAIELFWPRKKKYL